MRVRKDDSRQAPMNHSPPAAAVHGMDRTGIAAGGADRTPQFRSAMKHSRRVRLVRRYGPPAVGLALALLALGSYFDPLRLIAARLPVENAGLVISGTKITMAQPKLSGYTRDSRAYEFSAKAAAQDVTKPDLVELQDIHARLEMQDRTTMDLTAADGVFNRKAGVLTLQRRILLSGTNGIQVRLTEAVVETASGNIVSERPVEVISKDGTLNANRLEVIKSGEVVRFDGGVVMHLNSLGGVPER